MTKRNADQIQTQTVQGITVPQAAAERVMAVVNAAKQAADHSNELIAAVAAALGAQPGAALVQTQTGQLVFMPPAEAMPAPQPDGGLEVLHGDGQTGD